MRTAARDVLMFRHTLLFCVIVSSLSDEEMLQAGSPEQLSLMQRLQQKLKDGNKGTSASDPFAYDDASGINHGTHMILE